MSKYKIKKIFNPFILNTKENKIKEDKNNFWIFSPYKNNVFKKRINFKINISKSLLLIELLLLMVIKLNLISSQSINKKRNIISQSSSIKLKIENSGNRKIYSNGTYDYCYPVVAPDEIYINGENQTEIKYEYNFQLNNNEITLIWYNPLKYTNCMFRDCTAITAIDLSNFDDSQLTQMKYMFRGCNSLKKIEMSNIKGNKVTDAGYLFSNCNKLETLDLTNFQTPNNNYLHYIFANCTSLISLNYPFINTNSIQNIDGLF